MARPDGADLHDADRSDAPRELTLQPGQRPLGDLGRRGGRIRRINEGTYSRLIPIGDGSTVIGTDEYRPAVRDWVINGENSRYVWSTEQVTARIRTRTPDEALRNPRSSSVSISIDRVTRRWGDAIGSEPRRCSPTAGTCTGRTGT